MEMIEYESRASNNFKLAPKKVLDELSQNDDLEELIYTIIDACPYDFEAIPTIVSFKYLSSYDKITQYEGVRYFAKMYELIDMLCYHKELIEKVQNQKEYQNLSKTKSLILEVECCDKDLFRSCQIHAINIYKRFSFKDSKIDDRKLAFCLNAIINEFFEEAFTSRLKVEDISKPIEKRSEFCGFDIFGFKI